MTVREIFGRLAEFDFGVLLDLPPTDFVATLVIPFVVVGLFFWVLVTVAALLSGGK